jgi:hypothetical protein
MSQEQGLTREQIIGEVHRSSHGKYAEYEPIIGPACASDPEFVARLIAWDFTHGQVKDSKVALPIISAGTAEFPDELVENSLAHLCLQPPRELLKALRYSMERGTKARRQHALEKIIRRYLEAKQSEPGNWERLAVRHRRPLKALYSLTRMPAPEFVSRTLWGFRKAEDGQKIMLGHAPGSIFADIANLSRMDPASAAATIRKWHLSPLVVSGAMAGSGKKQEDSAVVQATMDQMSDTEVVTRAASLERKGLSRDAGLKEAFRKKVSKATGSKKATLKTSVAAEEVEDESLKTMLRELQERQIQAKKDAGRGIDGNWLVILDKSQSQEVGIELGKHVAAAIAKFVTGRVWLVFCDTGAHGTEVTGLSLEKIQQGTKWVKADGATSYGVGLDWAISNKFDIDGVVIVGDGGENRAPVFVGRWHEYKKRFDKELAVYFYQTYCEPRFAVQENARPDRFEQYMNGGLTDLSGGSYGLGPVSLTKFDISQGQVDYYSIPNLVQQMKVNRFSMVDQIMACPLLTLDQVFAPGFAVAAQ